MLMTRMATKKTVIQTAEKKRSSQHTRTIHGPESDGARLLTDVYIGIPVCYCH